MNIVEAWELFRLTVAVSIHFIRTQLLKLCALSYITWSVGESFHLSSDLTNKTPLVMKKFKTRAKLWNGPGWDKVGIEFTGSQLDPNFLPSLAPTNHPSVLVDISIFFYLKEILNKKLQTNCLHISLDYIPLSLHHWLK